MPGQGSISGKGLAVLFAGGVLLWSGLNGKKATSALRDIIAGKNPNNAAGNPITSRDGGVADTITAQQATAGPGIGTPAAANKAIVKTVAASYGWAVGAEWAALDSVIMEESGYRNTIKNPTSTAYGMFQFLDSTWATVGGTKTSNAMLQAVYGMKYIKQRYGDPIKAQAFHLANGYY